MDNNFGGVGRKLKILVIGYGLETEHCLALADAGHEVFFYTQWSSAFPKFSDYAPGYGYEDRGLKKVKYIWDIIDDMDLIAFFDIGFGDLAEYLFRMGYTVYGARNAERIENDRVMLKKLQKRIGLPIQKTVSVTGVPNLREYLKKNPNKFVKVDTFRGDVESFAAESYDKVKPYLDEIEVNLGQFHESYRFIVEDFIKGIEPGWDLFFTNGDWVRPYLWGVEQSKSCYIGKFVNEMPEPIQFVADKLKTVLAKLDYRGAISTEIRITKDGTPYLIDVCMRYPYPLSSAYTYAIKNYPEVIWKIANGETVTLDVKDKYIGALPLSSSHADKYYVRLDFPEEKRANIKTRISAKEKGKYFAVRGMDVVYVVCETDNSYMNLIKKLQKLAKECGGYGVDTDIAAGLDKIGEVVQEYKKYGMGTF